MVGPPSAPVATIEFEMHMSHASPVVVTMPFMQYSVAHCIWQLPLAPQSHAFTSVTSAWMPAWWRP
jgi:hypothetical protein